MASSRRNSRNRLGLTLTARQPLGFFSTTRTDSSSHSSSSATSCSSGGLDVALFNTRLDHVAALRKHQQNLRHPLHRFWPQQYPVVVDADFLPLYTRHTPARPPSEQLKYAAAIPSFSNLQYRAPNAPVGGSRSSRDSSSSLLPWRHVPHVIPADRLSLWDDIRCVLFQLVINGSLFWVPVLIVWIWRKHCTTRRRKVFFVLFILSLILYPIRPKPAIRKWRPWTKVHRYHRTSVILEQAESFPPREPTIYAVFPHGIIPTAPALMATGDFANLLGHFRLTAASIVRWCMIYGQLIFLADAIPADRKSMRESLEKGSNLLVSPGGIAEIYETSPTQERLHLRDRLGLVRLAMQTGARLVPIYVFGHSQAYRLPWGVRFLQPVARLMRIALATFYGRFGLPVSFRVPLLFAVGRPLQLSQMNKPSKAEVTAAHQLFIGEVKRIFDSYKSLYGWGDRQLEIL